ncbi:MAG: fatty-acyl-CoA synthase [Pseudonocardiales bacterium]|nr:fatty-acyl-CoA synthase [Pseudonocardiales bacterium]
MSVFATDWAAHNAAWFADAPALDQLEDGRALTWRQVDAQVTRLAGALAELGVAKGDRIAVLAENDIRTILMQFACMRIGAILAPLNWRLAVPELVALCQDFTPVLMVHDETWADVASSVAEGAGVARSATWGIAGARHDIDAMIATGPSYRARREHLWSDPTHILYTSGTTGIPKGAVSTFGTLAGAAVNLESLTSMNGPGTKQFNPLPLFHAAGINAFANPILYGGGAITVARRFDPEQVMTLIGDPHNGYSHFTAVPTMYEFIAKLPKVEAADFSYVRQCHSGGTLAANFVKFFADLGLPIQQGYGGTEVGTYASFQPRDSVLTKPGSCGKPLRNIQLRLVEPGGTEDVADGAVGEAWISGPSVTPGYWNRPNDEGDTFVDGWYRSGDALQRDEDGFLYVVDRYKDMFKSGGESVFPAEVERVLTQHPHVDEAAVLAVSDDTWGSVGVAVVVAAPGASVDGEEITSFCRERLARYKVPKSVVLVSSLPRNATGKVVKAELRDQLADNRTGGQA